MLPIWDLYDFYMYLFTDNNYRGYNRNSTIPFSATAPSWTYQDYIWSNIMSLRLYENITHVYDNIFTLANSRGYDQCLYSEAFVKGSGCTCMNFKFYLRIFFQIVKVLAMCALIAPSAMDVMKVIICQLNQFTPTSRTLRRTLPHQRLPEVKTCAEVNIYIYLLMLMNSLFRPKLCLLLLEPIRS